MKHSTDFLFFSSLPFFFFRREFTCLFALAMSRYIRRIAFSFLYFLSLFISFFIFNIFDEYVFLCLSFFLSQCIGVSAGRMYVVLGIT